MKYFAANSCLLLRDEGKNFVVNFMQTKSTGVLFLVNKSCFLGCLGILGLWASLAFTPAFARERVLLDAGWRFQLGDPVDVTTNVTVYQEINNLAWAQNAELNTETTLQSQRPDPVATHAGENVSFVLTNYNDIAWRTALHFER